nr:hypothetical protein CFP56_36362 [Quercus suber]
MQCRTPANAHLAFSRSVLVKTRAARRVLLIDHEQGPGNDCDRALHIPIDRTPASMPTTKLQSTALPALAAVDSTPYMWLRSFNSKA